VQINVTANKQLSVGADEKMELVPRETPVKATIEYNLGATLKEAVDLFGETVVLSYFHAGAKIGVQDVLRRKLESNVSVDDAIKQMATYKLGIRSGRAAADPKQTAEIYLKALAASDPEAFKALVASVKK